MDFKERIREKIDEKYPRARTSYCEECGKPTEHIRINDIFSMTRPITEVLRCQECGHEKIVNYDVTFTI